MEKYFLPSEAKIFISGAAGGLSFSSRKRIHFSGIFRVGYRQRKFKEEITFLMSCLAKSSFDLKLESFFPHGVNSASGL